MADQVTEAEIDAGAKALRDRQMAGRITRPWESTPNSDKRKWRNHASCVLTAAVAVRMANHSLAP